MKWLTYLQPIDFQTNILFHKEKLNWNVSHDTFKWSWILVVIHLKVGCTWKKCHWAFFLLSKLMSMADRVIASQKFKVFNPATSFFSFFHSYQNFCEVSLQSHEHELTNDVFFSCGFILFLFLFWTTCMCNVLLSFGLCSGLNSQLLSTQNPASL